MAAMNRLPNLLAPGKTSPWLLYVYPWMPYPRRVMIYLREKDVPESMVKLVPVNLKTKEVDKKYPPKPIGSLPILAIPTKSEGNEQAAQSYTYIRQSIAIMNFLEELCNNNEFGFTAPRGSLSCTNVASGVTPAQDALDRARMNEILVLADEVLTAWNSVRTFGTGAGTMSLPAAAKEMLRWERRSLMTIERFLQDRDLSLLRKGVYGHVTIADIVLFQFFEFVDVCYGVDMTIGSGEVVTDVYGREVKEVFPKLVEFYQTFKERESARKDPERDEMPPEFAAKNMQNWADGVL